MSVVTYTANDRAALIAGHVAGELYSFEIAFMRFEKSYNSPKKQHTSIGGVVETVLARTDELIAVEIGPYDSDDIPQIEEFIKSVSSGEGFQLDVHGTVAVASLPISAKLNDNKNTPTRHGNRTYSLPFNVLANASDSSVGGVAPLPPVEEVETPVIAGWFSGQAGCDVAVRPTWASGGLFVREVNATGMSVFISSLMADDGGSSIVLWEVAPGFSLPGLPSTLALNSITSELTGDSGGIAAGDYPVAFIMTNAAGLVSDVSPVTIIRFFDPAVTPVDIVSIDAVEGSNQVFVNFSEGVFTDAGSAASYELDFSLYISDPNKTTPRGWNYISGGGTSRMKFTTDKTLVANIDTLVLDFVRTTSDLKSVENSTPVSDASKSFSIPVPGNAFFEETFEGLATGSSYKGSSNIIDSSNSAFGGKSVSMNYQAGVPNKGGFILDIPAQKKGDELWVQFYSRFDPGFLFNDSAGFKFLRFRTFNSAGNHLGYLDWYNASSRYSGNAWYYRNEVTNESNIIFGDENTENIDPGTFHKYEMYVRLDNNSAVGKVRMWRDNALLSDSSSATLKNSTDEVTKIYFSTFFNPDTKTPFKSFNPVTGNRVNNSNSQTGSPQNQSQNIDAIKIYLSADSMPIGVDSSGNKFIG